jgi:hypothetical protein
MAVFFDNLLASRFVVLWRIGTFSYQDADSLLQAGRFRTAAPLAILSL